MSQRRRQARLQSLRFTGPPPPPRLYGPRPARPVPAAGASPRRSRAPTPRRLPGPTSSSCSRSASRSEAAAGPRQAGTQSGRWMEPEPRVPASPPGYYLRHPRLAPRAAARETGARRRADGSRPGPSPRLAPALRALPWPRPRAPRSREPGRAQSSPPPLLALASRLSHPPLVPRVSGSVPGTAIQTPAAREDRSPSRHPRISRAGGSRVRLPVPPACKEAQPCPTGPRGELCWHLPAGWAPRGPVPSGGTGVRPEGEHAPLAAAAGCLGGGGAVPVVRVSLSRSRVHPV